MRAPLIQRPRRSAPHRERERGVTLALVALAIVSIIAIAALSIDVGTLYEASAEAQRSADAAALAAARVLSMSGMTGDPRNTSGMWQQACDSATAIAQTVAGQDTVASVAPTATVTFTSTDGSNCGSAGAVAFGVNPMVTVAVKQPSVSTFFAHVFGLFNSNWRTIPINATATAEAFNPSGSENFSSNGLNPVQPRCVKPWIVPNQDPGTGGGPFVSTADGSIVTQGIRINTVGTGSIGESFALSADCNATPSKCNGVGFVPPKGTAGTLQYVPGQVLGTPVAVTTCANGDLYQQAVAGCDQTTPYQCGVPVAGSSNPSYIDFNENPSGPTGDTSVAMQCLVNESAGTPDQINTDVYPYQITAGAGNPINHNGDLITSSNSIVSLPIYDSTAALPPPNGANQVPVTIVGFLQVFVQTISSTNGNLAVYVLNVSGCGNGSTNPVNSPALTGTSPVPVRLITPP